MTNRESNDDVKEYHEAKRYSEKVAFRNKAACQKYCDWLNERIAIESAFSRRLYKEK